MNNETQSIPEPGSSVTDFRKRQDFTERMNGATASHVIISDKRAVVLTTKTDEKPEPEETLAPLPQGSRVWYWKAFQELFFLIPGREPFRVAGVQSYSIKKWSDLGLRRVGKKGPFVRAVHK